MNVTIKESVRNYHVGFKRRHQSGAARVVTTCEIRLGVGDASELIATGVTVLGKRDKDDSYLGCKIAFERALEKAKLGRAANEVFWQEFHRTHRRPISCRWRMSTKGNGVDWCLKHKQSCTPKAACRPATGGVIRKRNNLRFFSVNPSGGESFVERRFRQVVDTDDYTKAPEDFWREEEMRWVEGVWKVADERLGAKMLAMSLHAEEEFKKLQAALAKRPGVTRVIDEYIIDPKTFKSQFEIGEVVTWRGKSAKVVKIDNLCVTVQPLVGCNQTVFEWALEKRVGWWVAFQRCLHSVGSIWE
jgi:hypothetical protein